MELLIINRSSVLPRRPVYQAVKRALDVILCLLILPFALPVMFGCALAIFFDSSGPIFFVQERIGKGGHPFRMVKFRTLRPNLDNSYCRSFMQAFVKGESGDEADCNKIFKPVQASQITRVGRFLRKTSLDEVPQIINVLKGEMSLVGPRPNIPWEVEAYRPWHHERLEVLPGITGLAQVHGRSCIKFDTIVSYDIEYIERRSIELDLKILWWTVMPVFLGKNTE